MESSCTYSYNAVAHRHRHRSSKTGLISSLYVKWRVGGIALRELTGRRRWVAHIAWMLDVQWRPWSASNRCRNLHDLLAGRNNTPAVSAADIYLCSFKHVVINSLVYVGLGTVDIAAKRL